ncbi:hypothetical protein G7Y79_00001g001750 [Physcia stellaris]|nr:hypothetical protein G7Y79_00001g001750 [Physcia stellaris]
MLLYLNALESLRVNVVFVDYNEDKDTGDVDTEDDRDWYGKLIFRRIVSYIDLVARKGLLIGQMSKITVRLKDFESAKRKDSSLRNTYLKTRMPMVTTGLLSDSHATAFKIVRLIWGYVLEKSRRPRAMSVKKSVLEAKDDG